MSATLPVYAKRLDVLHRALVDDFRRLVDRVPLEGAESILDAGCGDGFFTGLLADRLSRGQVVAVDRSKSFLSEMSDRLERPIDEGSVRPELGNVLALPFSDGRFDVVWSAHSMQSYPSVERVLAEFDRVLKPGGLLAILETDNLHSLVFNWPPEIEIAIRRAEHQKFTQGADWRGGYFPRFAIEMLRGAEFCDITRHFECIYRQPPIEDAIEHYVRLYLHDALDRHGSQLDATTCRQIRELASPDSESYLPKQENFYFGSHQILFTARKQMAA